MKKLMTRFFASLVATVMMCLIVSVPVFAANSLFSKTTVKLNAVNGGLSKVSSLSSGSVPAGSVITKVELYCNVASGTDPYTIYVESPSGTMAIISGPISNSTVTTSVFNGENPYGTWKIWIRNLGVSYSGHPIPTSTVTVTLKVY